MTTVTTLVALLPVMFADGRGADVARAMALPVFGGMLVEPLTSFIVPTIYCATLNSRWRWDSQIRYGLNLMKDPRSGECHSMNSNGFKSLAEQIASISCYCAIVLACCTCQSLPAQMPAKTGVPANEAEKNSPHKMPYDSRVRLAFDQFQVETSIGGQGIQVRLHKPEGQFIPMHDAKGVVFMKISGEPKRYRFDLLPNAKGALVASANLMRAKGKQVELEILLASLPTPFVPRHSQIP